MFETAAVVALHCSGSSGRQWQALADRLGEGYAVVAPDFIGSPSVGQWCGERPFSLEEEADAIVAFIDDWSGPVHLVGHSYGGGVALAAAARRPGRIAGLALYEPTAFHLLRAMGAECGAALEEIEAVAREVECGVLTGTYRKATAHFVDYWNGAGAFARMKPHVQAELLQYLPKAVLDFHALLHGATTLDTFAALDIPTLLVRGEHAPRPTAAIVRLLHAAAPLARLAIIPGAGHMGPITHAEEVAAILARHVADVAAARMRPAARVATLH